MFLVNAVTVLLIASCVFADVLAERKCPPGPGTPEINCSKQILEHYIRDYIGGAPDFGVKALDPIYIDQIEVAEEALGIKSVFPFLRVAGFRNVIIEDISDENDTDAVTYSMKFDFVAEGPISVEFPKKKKAFVGDIRYEGGASATITYMYNEKTLHYHSTVKTVYEAGPEQITCESLHAKSVINPELGTALFEDPDIQAVKEQWAEIQKYHQGRVVCAIAKEVFKAGMHNIRAFWRWSSIKN